jgi:hypothetical protein
MGLREPFTDTPSTGFETQSKMFALSVEAGSDKGR